MAAMMKARVIIMLLALLLTPRLIICAKRDGSIISPTADNNTKRVKPKSARPLRETRDNMVFIGNPFLNSDACIPFK